MNIIELIFVLLLKKPVDVTIPLCLEKLNQMNQVPKFGARGGVKITKYEYIFKEGYTENWAKELLLTLGWILIVGHIQLNTWIDKNY